MHCFQVTESVRPGLFIDRADVPCIITPNSCSTPLVLSQAVVEFVAGLPPEVEARLKRAFIDFRQDTLVFHPPRQHNRRRDDRACVHLETAGGVGGKVYLSSNAWDGVLSRGRVSREHRSFPDVGIEPYCSEAYLKKVNAGVDCLDLLVLMYPGASFRIYRDGDLDGASPQMFLHWTGHELRATLPRTYDERTAAGFFTAATTGA